MYKLENIENKKYYDYNLSKEEQCKLHKIIKSFNTSKDIDYKTNLAKELKSLVPEFDFGTCDFCHNFIIYSHEIIRHGYHKSHIIQIEKPVDFIRRINDVDYHIRCCEKCMLEHFKDNPPKSKTLIFSKGQKYSQFVYNLPKDLAKEIRNNTTACTLKSMIRKWGEIEGPKHWEIYRQKQAYTNSFEYFHEKYGMSEIDFIKQKKKHGLNSEEFINKHGLDAYNKYVERQRYTTTKKYFIETYGEIEGNKKYFNVVNKRSLGGFNSSENFKTYSNISQELFNIIYHKLKENNINDEIYYETLNNEYSIYCEDNDASHFYKLDFYDKDKNLIIEFLGDYWHANPNKYLKNDKLFFQHDNKTHKVENIWNNDKLRKRLIIEKMNNPVYIEIWESQYKTNKEKIINNILKQYYGI